MLVITLALLGCRNKDYTPVEDSGLLQDTSGLTTMTDEDGDGWSANDDCDDNDPDVGKATAWNVDGDGDGYGTDETVEACDQPAGTADNADDCDDADPNTYPDAAERCDDVDNDCDGEIDEDVTDVWYEDADLDGWGSDTTLDACDPPEGYAARDGDCDDTVASVNPNGLEVCNDVDDDCDGEIDEDALDMGTWYADADADGYGAGEGVETCDAGDGYVENGDDCDDASADVNPGAVEVCNDVDDDCNGWTDDDDPGLTDGTDWYRDADADTYGAPDTSTTACEQPTGYVDDDTDCDDTDADLNPETTWYEDADGDGLGSDTSTESCEQPSGYVARSTDCDDTDAGVSDSITWYIDYDSDGYGSTAYTAEQCDQPSGYVQDATDCDDGEADVNPGADEVCNDVDDDCDGDTDEDSALDTTTWYEDADGDSYGNASVSDVECDQPSGYVADDTDCDDTDATTYPDARELYDGVDNDCDGDVDDAWWTGSGNDGSLTASTETNLTDSGDILVYGVTAISGSDVTVDATTSLSAGDEVLVINVHGGDSAYTNVGVYEFGGISSVSGTTVTLTSSLAETFGESSNSDLTDQTIVLQRVPNYTDVTVQSGGSLIVDAWDGSRGGILAFRASGTVSVESGGSISASGLGYSGGATGTSYNCDSYQGESYAGEGDGDGDGACSAYNETYGHWANNYGGGGAHITGAGGDYAGGATDGDSWTGGSATPPYAGDTYGSADLGSLFFGSGGGGVWYGSTTPKGGTPGAGGSGAGILFIAAYEIEAVGTGAISADGADTNNAAQGSWTYGAGGGAGGSVWLMADVLDLDTDSVTTLGGIGESLHTRLGGDGGVGRIRLDYNELNGTAYGSTTTEEEDSTDPDVGASASP
ncbi:MAG: hypothetical protein GY913_16965 [Proteobacteria bacterium]|nr:hypothetical protein [Pseudomonadota bacterium]